MIDSEFVRQGGEVACAIGMITQCSCDRSGNVPCQGAQPGPDLVLRRPLVPQRVPGERAVAAFLQQVQLGCIGGVVCDGEQPQDDGVDFTSLR